MQRNCVVLICLCCSGHTTLVENSSVVRVCTLVHHQPQLGMTCKDVWSVLKQPFSSRLVSSTVTHEGRGEKRIQRTLHSDKVGNTGWGRGWRDGEIKRDDGSGQSTAGTMTWKSRAGDHTLHWHIWRGAKYPDLHTHTHWVHTNTHGRARTRAAGNAIGGSITKRSQLWTRHLNRKSIITAMPTLTDL